MTSFWHGMSKELATWPRVMLAQVRVMIMIMVMVRVRARVKVS